jgi:hypothetical protein
MMIQMFELMLLCFVIRSTWCERQFRMLAATVSRLLRRWTIRAVLAAQTGMKKSPGSRCGRRAQPGARGLALKPTYWRSARTASTGMSSALRLRKMRQL